MYFLLFFHHLWLRNILPSKRIHLSEAMTRHASFLQMNGSALLVNPEGYLNGAAVGDLGMDFGIHDAPTSKDLLVYYVLLRFTRFY